MSDVGYEKLLIINLSVSDIDVALPYQLIGIRE